MTRTVKDSQILSQHKIRSNSYHEN